MNNKKNLLLIGFGNVAKFFNEVAKDYGYKFATTRQKGKCKLLESFQLSPLVLEDDQDFDKLKDLSRGAHILVSYPPSPETDDKLLKSISAPSKLIYISSTSVYGAIQGRIDESTPVDPGSPHSKSRLAAESFWLENFSGVVLRAPALYGPGYGLHKRLLAGKYRLPGDGTKYSSRIHLADLANIINLVFESSISSDTFVLGDKCPATHLEVVDWLCNRLGLDKPDSISLDDAHYTLQSNRQIDSTRILEVLNYELQYPDFKKGLLNCLESDC